MTSHRSLYDAGLALAVVVLVAAPALFTKDGFELDFTNHLWLVSVQQYSIQHNLAPTLFLNTPSQGVFNPFFMFYGATLYASAGLLGLVFLGHTAAAYLATIVLAIAAAYGGLLWLARQLGARSWMAHAPAITFVTSAYYVTNLYGRGDWPELIACSAIPLLVASTWRLARAPRIELGAGVAFVASLVFFTGSHNVTLVWGSLALIALAICLRVGLGRRFAIHGRPRAAAVLALAVLALAVNAWFLIPDLLHGESTQISAFHVPWATTSWINTPRVLFDPLRYVPFHYGTPALYVQAPVWFLVWALACAALLRSSAAVELRRAFLAVAVVLAGFLVLILVEVLYDLLPQVLQTIQFPYRLNTFVSLAVAGLVLVAVLAVEAAAAGPRGALARMLRAGLAVATAISVGLCVWQLWVPRTDVKGSYHNRDLALRSVHETPRTWYQAGGSYADFDAPVINAAPSRIVLFDPARVSGDSASFAVAVPPGLEPFSTNVLGGPYAVAFHGVQLLGRMPDGRDVVRRSVPGSGPIDLKIERSGGLLLPLVITLVAVAVLLALFVYGVLRRFNLLGPVRLGNRLASRT